MRRVAVVTTARSDYGIYRPILDALRAERDVELQLIAGGMHLAPEFGLSVTQIERDGYEIADRVELLVSSDTGLGAAKSIGLGVIGFADSFSRLRPDIVVVLGDRFEMHAAALATLPLQVPLAHIHGGEVTDGAIDDALRHGISKMAHLHFVSAEPYKTRLERLGEEPWRIMVTGAPSLDNLKRVRVIEPAELFASLQLPPLHQPLLVTYHPVTRRAQRADAQIDALLEALRGLQRPIVFTMPNADPAGRALAERIRAFAKTTDNAYITDNLGTERYFNLMRGAGAMAGNSSSGIIEAASFGLPVVNIGSRQDGRERNANVIDVQADEDALAIRAALDRALSSDFRASIAGVPNIYGNGDAAGAIAARLAEVPLDAQLLQKRFYDA